MWPSPSFWCRSLKAPRTSIESLAWTSRSRPGPPISTIRSSGRGRAAGLVERGAGREDVAGVEADPGLGVVVEGGEVGREVLDAGAQRPALAGGGLEQQPRGGVVGDRVQQRQQARRGPAASPRRTRSVAAARVDERAGVHDDALGADLGRPLEVVRDRGDRLLVRRGGGRAEVDQVRRVDEDPHAALGRRRPEAPRRSAGSPAECAQPRGLPTKTWKVSQPTASALASAPVDEALADGDVGADRVAEAGSRGTPAQPIRGGRVRSGSA